MAEIDNKGITNLLENVSENTANKINKPSGTGETGDVCLEEKDIPEEQKSINSVAVLSPIDEIQKSYWESQKKFFDNKAKFWKIMYQFIPAIISVIVIILGFFTGIFTYRISNLSEPIGYLKSEVENLKTNFNSSTSQNNNTFDKIRQELSEERKQRESMYVNFKR